LHIRKTPSHVVWRFSPAADGEGNFVIKTPFKTIFDKTVPLKTLQLYADSVAFTEKEKIVLSLNGQVLYDETVSQATTRPLEAPADFDWESEYGLYLKGKDLANQRKFVEAETYFQKCLQKNKHHVPALGELAQLKYRQGLEIDALNLTKIALSVNTYDRQAEALKAVKEILHHDPLNHLARFEENLLNNRFDFQQFITNELPHEDFIEMAIWYRKAGLRDEALTLLKYAPKQLMARLWDIYLMHEKAKNPVLPQKQLVELLQSDPAFVFPSRVEDLNMLNKLQALIGKGATWQLNYYYGTALWQLNRIQEAKAQFSLCGNTPTFAPFYLAKAQLFKDQNDSVAIALARAYALAPDDWRVVRALSDFYELNGQIAKALAINDKLALKPNLRSHETYIVGQQRANLLEKLGRDKACIDLMKSLTILPNEGARGAHDLGLKT